MELGLGGFKRIKKAKGKRQKAKGEGRRAKGEGRRAKGEGRKNAFLLLP